MTEKMGGWRLGAEGRAKPHTPPQGVFDTFPYLPLAAILKIVMKLYSDIINKDFDYKVEEVDIVEEDLEEILPKVLSINDKSKNKDVKDIDKKFNFHSNMIEVNSNIKGRNSTKSKMKKWNIAMKLQSD